MTQSIFVDGRRGKGVVDAQAGERDINACTNVMYNVEYRDANPPLQDWKRAPWMQGLHHNNYYTSTKIKDYS